MRRFPSRVPVSYPMRRIQSSTLIMLRRIIIGSYSEFPESGDICIIKFEPDFSMTQPDVPVDGGLALFCPACPQIGINIPPENRMES